MTGKLPGSQEIILNFALNYFSRGSKIFAVKVFKYDVTVRRVPAPPQSSRRREKAALSSHAV